MTPVRVVKAEILADGLASASACRPRSAAEQLRLQGPKEAFRDRVVPAVASATHAAGDTASLERLAVRLAGVLTAPIPMVEQAQLWLAQTQGHLERVEHQLLLKAFGHRPTHHPAREQIEDHRQVEPALPGPDIGDVCYPGLVRTVGGELSVEDVRGYRLVMLGIGGSPELAPRGALQAHLAHQTSYPLAAEAQTLGPQLGVDARAAVGPTASLVNRSDRHLQQPIIAPSPARRAVAPGVKTTRRDPKDSTKHSDRIVGCQHRCEVGQNQR